MRPHVRGRVEKARSPPRRAVTQCSALGDRGGAVVARRNDVAVTIDEERVRHSDQGSRLAGSILSDSAGQLAASAVGGVESVLRAQVQLEIRGDEPELAQCTSFELPHTLAGDAERRADVLERLRLGAGEPEPKCDDLA